MCTSGWDALGAEDKLFTLHITSSLWRITGGIWEDGRANGKRRENKTTKNGINPASLVHCHTVQWLVTTNTANLKMRQVSLCRRRGGNSGRLFLSSESWKQFRCATEWRSVSHLLVLLISNTAGTLSLQLHAHSVLQRTSTMVGLSSDRFVFT
jgi:hypothetical protein